MPSAASDFSKKAEKSLLLCFSTRHYPSLVFSLYAANRVGALKNSIEWVMAEKARICESFMQ
jgi:hypothetical protein